MECAHCHTELWADDRVCPACGRPAGAVERASVVEGTVISNTEEMARKANRSIEVSPRGSKEVLDPMRPTHPAVAALARLPALAWRQPAVRSAVRTGASAVALTVALRLASRWATSRGARRVARENLMPGLADLLAQDANGHAVVRRGRTGEVTETFIYFRRTVRPL